MNGWNEQTHVLICYLAAVFDGLFIFLSLFLLHTNTRQFAIAIRNETILNTSNKLLTIARNVTIARNDSEHEHTHAKCNVCS